MPGGRPTPDYNRKVLSGALYPLHFSRGRTDAPGIFIRHCRYTLSKCESGIETIPDEKKVPRHIRPYRFSRFDLRVLLPIVFRTWISSYLTFSRKYFLDVHLTLYCFLAVLVLRLFVHVRPSKSYINSTKWDPWSLPPPNCAVFPLQLNFTMQIWKFFFWLFSFFRLSTSSTTTHVQPSDGGNTYATTHAFGADGFVDLRNTIGIMTRIGGEADEEYFGEDPREIVEFVDKVLEVCTRFARPANVRNLDSLMPVAGVLARPGANTRARVTRVS